MFVYFSGYDSLKTDRAKSTDADHMAQHRKGTTPSDILWEDSRSTVSQAYIINNSYRGQFSLLHHPGSPMWPLLSFFEATIQFGSYLVPVLRGLRSFQYCTFLYLVLSSCLLMNSAGISEARGICLCLNRPMIFLLIRCLRACVFVDILFTVYGTSKKSPSTALCLAIFISRASHLTYFIILYQSFCNTYESISVPCRFPTVVTLNPNFVLNSK